ncbi:hypothetical protein B1B04_05330 [Lysinibacillus sp. KCTC 33748]|uniref:hypothetical protein n=1 Tax=unclassified Lysinibacillus TaxID=2636778 RepID=UPI0009A7170E|nr:MULTISPECIES: hypothetical protein [unclassified Lysinibacillus]OXS76396.1 hypothetical protein B1B04_05330 [Lysinibacillus sp. KCTC 33748]SKB45312.1 hypothetical protein SAMN06295926_102550 [Lysinibacillus sp. AC-3]
MAKIDKEHQVFIQLTEDQNYMKFVRENAPIYSRQLKEDITKNKAVINKKVASFVKWAIQMSEKEYYLQSVPISGGVFTLTNRDFGSMVYFRYCSTLTEATERLLKIYKEAIEIVQLHSKIKGSGSKIISEFIKLSRDIQLPLVLYTETESLVKYYEQYKFKNYGKQGHSNEYLMIRIPESNSKFKFKF